MDKVNEARNLVESALRKIDMRENRGAPWRLADALGLLSEHFADNDPTEEIIGINVPTGRGYIVGRADPDRKSVV